MGQKINSLYLKKAFNYIELSQYFLNKKGRTLIVKDFILRQLFKTYFHQQKFLLNNCLILQSDQKVQLFFNILTRRNFIFPRRLFKNKTKRLRFKIRRNIQKRKKRKVRVQLKLFFKRLYQRFRYTQLKKKYPAHSMFQSVGLGLRMPEFNLMKFKSVTKSAWLFNKVQSRLFLEHQKKIQLFLVLKKKNFFLLPRIFFQIGGKQVTQVTKLQGALKKKLKCLLVKRFLNYKKLYFKNLFLYAKFLMFLSRLSLIRFTGLSRVVLFKILKEVFHAPLYSMVVQPLLFKFIPSFQKFFLTKVTHKRQLKKFLMFQSKFFFFKRLLKLKKKMYRSRFLRFKSRKIVKFQKRRLVRLVGIQKKLNFIARKKQKRFFKQFLFTKLTLFIQFLKKKYKVVICKTFSLSVFKQLSFFYVKLMFMFFFGKKLQFNILNLSSLVKLFLRGKGQLRLLRRQFKTLYRIGRFVFFYLRSLKLFQRIDFKRYLRRTRQKKELYGPEEIPNQPKFLYKQPLDPKVLLAKKAHFFLRKFRRRKRRAKHYTLNFVKQNNFSWMKRFAMFTVLGDSLILSSSGIYLEQLKAKFRMKIFFQLQKNTYIRRKSLVHHFSYVKPFLFNTRGRRRRWMYRKRLLFRGYSRARKKIRRFKFKVRRMFIRTVLGFKAKHFFSHFIFSFISLYKLNVLHLRRLFHRLHQRKGFRRYIQLYPQKFVYRVLRLLKVYRYSVLFNPYKQKKRSKRFFKSSILLKSAAFFYLPQLSFNTVPLSLKLLTTSVQTGFFFTPTVGKKSFYFFGNLFFFSAKYFIGRPAAYLFYFRSLVSNFQRFNKRKTLFLNKILKKVYMQNFQLFLKKIIRYQSVINTTPSFYSLLMFRKRNKKNKVQLSKKRFFRKRFFFFKRFRFLNLQLKALTGLQRFVLNSSIQSFFIKARKKTSKHFSSKVLKILFRFSRYKKQSIGFKSFHNPRKRYRYKFARKIRKFQRRKSRHVSKFFKYVLRRKSRLRRDFFWWIKGTTVKPRRGFFVTDFVPFMMHYFHMIRGARYKLRLHKIIRKRARALKMRRASTWWVVRRIQKKTNPIIRAQRSKLFWKKLRSRNLIIYLRSCSFYRFFNYYLYASRVWRRKTIFTTKKKSRFLFIQKLKGYYSRLILQQLKASHSIQCFFLPKTNSNRFYKVKLFRTARRRKYSKWVFVTSKFNNTQQLPVVEKPSVSKNTNKKKFFQVSKHASVAVFLKYLNNIHVRHAFNTVLTPFSNEKLAARALQKISYVLKQYLHVSNVQIKLFQNVATLFRKFKKRKLFKFIILKRNIFSAADDIIFARHKKKLIKYNLFSFSYFYKACYRSMLKQQFYTRKFFLSSALFIIILNCLFHRMSTMFFLLYFSFLLRRLRKHLILLTYMDRLFKFFFNPMRESLFPVSGIRFVLRGRVNGTPRKKNRIHSYGVLKMQTLQFNCDFNHTLAFTKRYGTIGLRMWRFF